MCAKSCVASQRPYTVDDRHVRKEPLFSCMKYVAFFMLTTWVSYYFNIFSMAQTRASTPGIAHRFVYIWGSESLVLPPCVNVNMTTWKYKCKLLSPEDLCTRAARTTVCSAQGFFNFSTSGLKRQSQCACGTHLQLDHDQFLGS